ncbi:uncharacterized protein LOC134204845 [Armigeres subalbatus]|uniref:uncharacterized protein LOC134204845 n=1 Tax=Armigeres subalbatus TaxID=124917 RepID=UPI002ED23268
MSSNDRRIRNLKLRQRSIYSSFALIKAFVENYDANTDATEVPVRLESLVVLWNDYNKVQSELESLDETTIEELLKQRTEMELSYHKVKGFLLSVNNPPPTSLANSRGAHVHASTLQVRLPDVKLPVFNGNLEHWLNFHDLYLSLVHSSQELSSIQKFYYLRSSLSGDALKLIQPIPISATNYTVAWNLLVEHFQNTTRLKSSYVDALFEFPTVKRESANELHSLVERFEANVRILQQLGEQTEAWDILLIRMLSSRLDSTTRRDWEEYSSTLQNVTFKQLTAFIQRRVNVLHSINHKVQEFTMSSSAKKPIVARPIASHGASQYNPRKCILCSEHHPLYMCSTFSKMSIEDKEKEIRRHQLCRNCLRRGHLSRECPSNNTCRRCKARHHTQLCDKESSNSSTLRACEVPPTRTTTSQASNEQPSTSASATYSQPASYSSTGRKHVRVILATAIVHVIDDNGTSHVARAFLASGSECCFASESFPQRLKVQRKKVSIVHPDRWYRPIDNASQAQILVYHTVSNQ